MGMVVGVVGYVFFGKYVMPKLVELKDKVKAKL